MPKITTVHHESGRLKKPNYADPNAKVPLLERKRVAAYCRVSTLQEEQELSYEAQQKYYKALFENDPHKILISVYGDEGITGTSVEKRPGFMDMMRDAEHGRLDEIYTKSISRFARNFAECLEYVRKLQKLGIVVHFEKEGFSTEDKNIEMVLSLMAIMAQEESNSISQNITLAHDHYNKQGDPCTQASYGYKRDKKKTDGIHKWRINEKEAEVVRKVFSLYLEGISEMEIAKRMNELEAENNSKKRWTKNSISNMLRRETYVGDIITNKTYTVDYLTHKSKVNNGERPQYYLKNHHEAIISREDFEKVQKILGRSLPKCMKQD